MRRNTKRFLTRATEARPIRRRLIADAQSCQICGHSPRRLWKDKPRECSELCCHEIANGPLRQKALDKPFAILVLCSWCNQYVVADKGKWPESRQLATLQRRSPERYSLVDYNALVNPRAPNRITQEEVDAWR